MPVIELQERKRNLKMQQQHPSQIWIPILIFNFKGQ